MLAAWRRPSISEQRGKSCRKVGYSLATVDPGNGPGGPSPGSAHHVLDRPAGCHLLADDTGFTLRGQQAGGETSRPVKCKPGRGIAAVIHIRANVVAVGRRGPCRAGRQKGRKQSDDATSRHCSDARNPAWRQRLTRQTEITAKSSRQRPPSRNCPGFALLPFPQHPAKMHSNGEHGHFAGPEPSIG